LVPSKRSYALAFQTDVKTWREGWVQHSWRGGASGQRDPVRVTEELLK